MIHDTKKSLFGFLLFAEVVKPIDFHDLKKNSNVKKYIFFSVVS